MRKRKEPPLGRARAVRTIPITAAEPVRDRRPPVDLDPALADLATGLLPPSAEPRPSTWLSWSVRDQDGEQLPSAWNTPVVDGVAADGEGRGFPEFAPDLSPITEAEVTTAATAGWPYDPATPERAPSFLRQVSGIFQSEEAAIALTAAPAAPSPAPDFLSMPRFDPPGVADSIALHPSMAHRPMAPPAPMTPPSPMAPPAPMAPPPAVEVPGSARAADVASDAAPAPVSPTSAAEAAPSVEPAPADEIDAADFVARLERGASMAMNEAQLLSLAQRAVRRLTPDGSGLWLTTQLDETLAVRLTMGDDAHPGCGITESRMCPAIAAGQAQRFDRSDELDACPHLLAADAPPCAAVCVPADQPGPLQGVLFVSAPVRTPFDDAHTALLARTVEVITARLAEIRGIGG